MYDQPMGQGRTASFQDGTQVNSMALNTAHSMQQQAPASAMQQQPSGGFQPHSVLNQIMPSPNGMAPRDASRQLMGGQTLPSQNGMSENTYQQKQPLMSPYRSI